MINLIYKKRGKVCKLIAQGKYPDGNPTHIR